MTLGSFMSDVQTRSGLFLLRDNVMAALEVNPWADRELIQQGLEEESKIFIPIYAIRYDWHTKGKKVFLL